MKVFGIGLPRTGTTSVAMALMNLGFKTSHSFFDQAKLDVGDAFFDTPIYAVYPMLSRRYPDARYILTWRDPDTWHESFSRTLLGYLAILREASKGEPHYVSDIDRMCYTYVFGAVEDTSKEFLISRYWQHRHEAENFFADSPERLLILNMDGEEMSMWDKLCPFLSCEKPSETFPHINCGDEIDKWQKISHPNKISGLK